MSKILLSGGIKSGKSSFALKLSKKYSNKLFIATAVAFDNEMKKRIKIHKKDREKMGFSLIEEQIELSKVLKGAKEYEFIIIDCITVWINNLLYYEKDIEYYINEFLLSLDNIKNIVIVTNEVGMGIIPIDKLTREYVDILGNINKILAEKVDEFYFLYSGIPMKIK